MAKIRLAPGSFGNFAAFALSGGGAVTGASAEQEWLQIVGWLSMVLGAAYLIMGITINDQHWWKFRKRAAIKVDEAAARRNARRDLLIQNAREKIAMYDGNSVGGFLPWMEKQPEYYSLKPHFDMEKMPNLEKLSRTIHVVPGRGVIDDGKEFFIEEVERLAKEWGVD